MISIKQNQSLMKKTIEWFSLSLTNTNNFKDYFHPMIRVFSFPKQNIFKAKVLDVRTETNQTYSLIIKPSKKWQGFKAGQFIEITLEMDGRYLTRIFSISSAPSYYAKKGMIEVTIKKQNKGTVTPYLDQLFKTTDKISISAAHGEFIVKDPDQPLLFIAAGTGITPIKSMISDLCQSNSNEARDINLIYYARDNIHLFKQDFEFLASTNSNLKVNFINSTIEGRLNQQHLIGNCADYKYRNIYICGPSNMIQTTQELLLKNNINQDQINFEYFGAAPIYDLNIENQGELSFQLSEVKTKTNNQLSLLEQAESSGLKPASSCRMGVCHQCVCKKKQGVVYNRLTNKFSDSGEQDIQLCVSVAIGDVTLEI
jgi:ferredoxin-NADP reductase